MIFRCRSGHNTLLAHIQPVFTHPHYTSGIKTKRTLQRGLWCLIILSTSDEFSSLVRALTWCSDTQYAWFGRPKKTISFSYVFFINKRKVMYCVEKSLWIQFIRYDLPLEKGSAAPSEWMPSLRAPRLFCMYLIGKWRGEWEFVILKPVLGSSFSVCKFTQRGAQSFSNTSSLLCVHNWREKSVYIFFFSLLIKICLIDPVHIVRRHCL